MKIYRCNKCGNVLEVIVDGAIVPVCCSKSMEIVKTNVNEDEMSEKHIPIYTKDGNKIEVYVGKVLHPMTEDHYIEWIMLKTNVGSYRKYLKPLDSPSITFLLSNDDEEVINIYAYCNIHGLWSIA